MEYVEFHMKKSISEFFIIIRIYNEQEIIVLNRVLHK